ncbi:MBL fold metallo-hydrolase [Shouchella shacheensis]|uniref:MBL fold metallo-hydrolase n=1 Tax=Shouchella shacheensis TaxID=1649580 RepID=UPI00073FF864|nr:MBL fold metallo-hydrolase [Shouchella shacheensis]
MNKQLPLGPLQTNAFVLQNKSNECVIIDPGGDGDALLRWLHQSEMHPLAILLTHAHFDHMGAVDDVRNAFGCPVYIHEAEQEWLVDPSQNGSERFGLPAIKAKAADVVLTDKDEELTIGAFTFSLLKTPGHSPGSVSYYYQEEAIVFSGDALFASGIGRTDLPGGNHEQLLASIHEKLLTLPENTTVACGHGPVTTIGAEMDQNPFLSGF